MGPGGAQGGHRGVKNEKKKLRKNEKMKKTHEKTVGKNVYVDG